MLKRIRVFSNKDGDRVVVTRHSLEDIASKVIETLLVKNEQYADAWQDIGIFTPLMRIREKLVRVEHLNGKEILTSVGTNETIGDTLLDIIGYGMLGYLRWLWSLSQGATNQAIALDEETVLQWISEAAREDNENDCDESNL